MVYSVFRFRMQDSAMTNNVLAPASNLIDDAEPFIERYWSEHVTLDGDLNYYNCITCESRWEKPGECALYEQLDNLEEQQQEQKLKGILGTNGAAEADVETFKQEF